MQIHVSNSVVHNKPLILQMQYSLDLSNVFLSGHDRISVIRLRTHLFRMPWISELARSGCDPEYGSVTGHWTLVLTTGWGRHRQHWADIILESVALHPVHCTSHMYTGHRYCQANGHQSQTRSFSSYNVTVLHIGVNITPQHLTRLLTYCIAIILMAGSPH